MRPRACLALAAWLACGCATAGRAPSTPATLIRDVRVFDGARVLEGRDVLILDGRVAEIGVRLDAPEGARTVDGVGRTLLPGLIDAHFHVYYREQLEEALAAGITTVIDMGSDARVGRSVKAALAAERAPVMADVRLAGNPATVPHGYGTEKGVPLQTLQGPDEAAAFVDARIGEGSDHIKVLLDDGSAFGHAIPAIDRPTIEAVVGAARRRSKLTVAHVSTQRDARVAIEAGVDGLAHIFFDRAPEPDFAALAKGRGVFVIPTLTQGRGPQRKHGMAAVRALRDAGVPVLAGADGPNDGLLSEVKLLVEAGLTPVEALGAATSLPAAHFRLADRGRVAPGLRADLLLVEGNPAEDVSALRRVVAVWRGGHAVDRGALTDRFAARRRDGRVSDFDGDEVAAQFGGWRVQTDAEIGGRSEAAIRWRAGGAREGRGFMEVTGELRPSGQGRAFAGARFAAGTDPEGCADMSAKSELVLRARGDGLACVVGLFAQSRGPAPALVTFTPGEEWKEYRFPIRSFRGHDGRDLTGVFVGVVDRAGAFRLDVDDVAFR